ncbi:alpha-amylase [bacterium]|nr:alpha-amylase [bacterium]
MRVFDEYCEIHLDPNLAPHRWLFRRGETVQLQFGVLLLKQPSCGQVWVELNDGNGGRHQQILNAEPAGIVCNTYQLFIATLPPLAQGAYHYRIGYCDQFGLPHLSRQQRTVLVSDEVPRTLAEIDAGFLGVVDGEPLYGPQPQLKMTPSPKDWTQRLFYSIIIDRFAQDEEDYRQGLGWVQYDLGSPDAGHGGTLAGILQKLTYLKTLGVGAILLSPIYVNDARGYHGYHPLHLCMVDPRLGTLANLRDIVARAHDLGMAVILDVVTNHLPDLIDWGKFGGPPYGEFKYVRGHATAVLPYPEEARNTNLFHGTEYTDLINGRLFDFLEDWRTETPYVRHLLVQHLKYWIAATDIDGFRYDAVRHVGLDFWEPCLAEIERFAQFLGKAHFLQIAEHAGYTHEEIMPYHQARFTNFLDYPTYFTVQRAWEQGTGLQTLADYCCGLLKPTPPYRAGWRNNVMFLDNHDRTRILHEIYRAYPEPANARSALHFALTCLLLGPQPPVIYYGTEQEFDGALGLHFCEQTGQWIGHDHYVREDMFANPACTWKFGPINRPQFPPYSTAHPTFQWIGQLATLRAQHQILQTGTRTILRATRPSLRTLLIHASNGAQPLLVLLNEDHEPLHKAEVVIPTSYGNFQEIDLLASTGGTLALNHNQVQVTLPPFGVIVGQLTAPPTLHQHDQMRDQQHP